MTHKTSHPRSLGRCHPLRLLLTVLFSATARQVTGERERCYLVGLEASGWGMGTKKGTKGSFPEARAVTGEPQRALVTPSSWFFRAWR